MEGPAEAGGKFAVSHRLGRRQVVGPGGALAGEEKLQRSCQVLHVDPRKPLLAAAEPPAQAESEDGQHFTERAAPPSQNDSETGDDDPGSLLLGLAGLCLPLPADPGEEVGARRVVLIEVLVTVEAVVADGGGGKERDAGGLCRQGIDQVHGGENPALCDETLVRPGPPGKDTRAGEVDDQRAPGQMLLPGAPAAAVADDDLHGRVQLRGAGPGVKAHHGNVMALLAERVGQIYPDEPRSTRDEDVHSESRFIYLSRIQAREKRRRGRVT
jgi:hypothetical protein